MITASKFIRNSHHLKTKNASSITKLYHQYFVNCSSNGNNAENLIRNFHSRSLVNFFQSSLRLPSQRFFSTVDKLVDTSFNVKVGDSNVTIGSSSLSPLADENILASQGKAVIHASLVSNSTPSEEIDDVLPLTVEYCENSYAFGAIPNTNNRNQRHGSDLEILATRVIDRAVRPLFPKHYSKETQVFVNLHSHDPSIDPVPLAVNSTSALLLASSDGVWKGPVGSVRVARMGGSSSDSTSSSDWVISPPPSLLDEADFHILYAGCDGGRCVMVEAGGKKDVKDEVVNEGLSVAHEAILPILQEMNNWREQLKQTTKDPLLNDSLPSRPPSILLNPDSERVLGEMYSKLVEASFLTLALDMWSNSSKSKKQRG